MNLGRNHHSIPGAVFSCLAIALLLVVPAGAAPGEVLSHQKISDIEGGFTGTLNDSDEFGSSVAHLGDLDGDGVSDIAVGAPRDGDGGALRGAVWVLFLNTDGTVKSHQKISSTEGGFTGTLTNVDLFGSSVAGLGDQDGDGVNDLAVGAINDQDGVGAGAVWILFLNTDGTVKSHQKISDTEGGFTGTLLGNNNFGGSLAALGDWDGDGVGDLAVGAPRDRDGGRIALGAVWILFLNTDGTVKSHQKISAIEGGFTGTLDDDDLFGRSLASPGDLNFDLWVGAPGDDDGGTDRGAVWGLSLDTDGTVMSHQKISDTEGGFDGILDDGDAFGFSLAYLGDIDGDGEGDLAVGAPGDDDGGDLPVVAVGDDDGGTDFGAVWYLPLDTDGTVMSHQKISAMEGGFTGTLNDFDAFGTSMVPVRDLDGDGVGELAVGAVGDGDGGSRRGTTWMLFLDAETCGDSSFPTCGGACPAGEFCDPVVGFLFCDCQHRGACCVQDSCIGPVNSDSCMFTFGGTYQGDDTTCDPDPCGLPACGDSTFPTCGGVCPVGEFCEQAGFGSCSCVRRGACCNEGTCVDDLSSSSCFFLTDTTQGYQGDDTTCDPNPCAPPEPCGFTPGDICAGECPTGGVCGPTGEFCVCLQTPVPCDQSFPTCDGECPIPGDVCGLLGEACACLETPVPCALILDGTCGEGVCPNPGDVCTPDPVVDCACVPPPAPPNDDCPSAESLPVPGSVVGNTNGATQTTTEFCGTSASAPEVWYAVTGTGNTITATTCNPGTNYDTTVQVFHDCGGCDELQCEGGNDDQVGGFDPACDALGSGVNRASTFSWCSELGANYDVLVGGFDSATGDFELTVSDNAESCDSAVPCPGGVGACCVPVVGCLILSIEDCNDVQGQFLGQGTTCDPEPPECKLPVPCGLTQDGICSGACTNPGEVCTTDPTGVFCFCAPLCGDVPLALAQVLGACGGACPNPGEVCTPDPVIGCTCLPPPFSGACCDHTDGTCTENVDETDCQEPVLEFFPDQSCSEISCDPCDPCDMNCDGDVNAFDIEPFLDLLFGPGVPCDTCTGDVNGDGSVNAFDIEPFLNCLFAP